MAGSWLRAHGDRTGVRAQKGAFVGHGWSRSFTAGREHRRPLWGPRPRALAAKWVSENHRAPKSRSARSGVREGVGRTLSSHSQAPWWPRGVTRVLSLGLCCVFPYLQGWTVSLLVSPVSGNAPFWPVHF